MLACFRPGEEAGTAVWDLLLGHTTPSGRLAQAWPRSAGFVHSQASPWFAKRQGDFDFEPNARDGPGAPRHAWAALFPFGFGLSYTSFALSVPVLASAATVRATDAGTSIVEVRVRVTNTGAAPGKTVVAVFHSKPLSRFVRFHNMLAAWVKTATLAPGAAANVTVRFPVSSLSTYNMTVGDQAVELGVYNLTVGQDSATAGSGAPLQLSVIL